MVLLSVAISTGNEASVCALSRETISPDCDLPVADTSWSWYQVEPRRTAPLKLLQRSNRCSAGPHVFRSICCATTSVTFRATHHPLAFPSNDISLENTWAVRDAARQTGSRIRRGSPPIRGMTCENPSSNGNSPHLLQLTLRFASVDRVPT